MLSYPITGGHTFKINEDKSNHNHGLMFTHKNEMILSKEQAEKLLTINLGGCNLESLYHVIVITQNSEILIDKKVVSKSEETAKFKVGAYACLEDNKLTPDDVTIIVKNLGSVKVVDK
ncbi:hypothetical protein [Paenibacillus sp. NAIST15-1]|uniref:hypothetical protein n=1 Tax=Paenibacillus sp. NAIST15-1 TaxID=1605994 RepID=UPI00086BE1A5|nr:hypothetical protein [Paenibacillus sp. NAIST15-1]GAV11384.1 hypothetical protein PBN151_1313 [Paenibacillus sp. NAIST15-1]